MKFRRSKRLQGVQLTPPPPGEEEYDREAANDVNNNQTVRVRRRGPSCAKDVWELPNNLRIEVEFNDYGQPDGDATHILSDFLGTIARNSNLCPLHYQNWKKFQPGERAEIIKAVKQRFTIVNCTNIAKANQYIVKSVGQKWKNYKSKLKKKYFKKDEFSLTELINKVPEGVNAHQWKDLVLSWNIDASEIASELGKRARSNVRTLHASGSTSFARRRRQFRQKHNRSPSRMEAFDYQHKGVNGEFVTEAARQMMEDASNLIVQKSVPVIAVSEKIALENEVYEEIVGLEDKYGRPRGYGLGVTAAEVKGVTSSRRNEHYEAMFREYQATIAEQSQALEQARAEQEEALERARAEQAEALEEAIERVRADARADARAEMLDILRGYGLVPKD